MIFIKCFVLLFIELLLQSTVFQVFNINGAFPDLLLITLISISIILGRDYAFIMGFAIGIAADIFYGSVIGIYGLSFLLTALVCSLISENMFKESLFAPISVFPIGVIVNHSVIYLVWYLLKMEVSIIPYLEKFNFVYWALNFIFLAIIYPIIFRLLNKMGSK